MSKQPIERLLDEADWTPLNGQVPDDGMPYATHKGVLKIYDISLTVYQLSDGRRVIDEQSLAALFGAAEKGEI